MKFSNNVVNLLAIKSLHSIGLAWINNNITGDESVDKLVSIIQNKSNKNSELTIENFVKITERIEFELENNIHNCDGAIALGDDNFPHCRGKIPAKDKPVVLFYKGDIGLLSEKEFNIATIGLLQPNEQIEKRERMIVSELVKYKANIVSGLALGCDTIAHDECLKQEGKTIVILPSTLNKIFPAKNKELAEKIVGVGGLLITEYYKEATNKNEAITRFIERDRLQAMFSDGIVLSASYAPNNKGQDSGSRHAMAKAKEYALPRAVIYEDNTDSNNNMYALNKKILFEDSDVFCFNRKFRETITQFVKKTQTKKSDTKQGSLFDGEK